MALEGVYTKEFVYEEFNKLSNYKKVNFNKLFFIIILQLSKKFNNPIKRFHLSYKPVEVVLSNQYPLPHHEDYT